MSIHLLDKEKKDDHLTQSLVSASQRPDPNPEILPWFGLEPS